jgi:hypothetical protein
MQPIEVHLYGGLRQRAAESRPDRESVVRLEPGTGETLATLLQRLEIPPAELGQAFLNGALCCTHNSMAHWLGYHQATRRPSSSPADGLDVPLHAGDRLGLFGQDMAMLVV